MRLISCIALIGTVFFFAFSICLIKAGVGELAKKKTRPEKNPRIYRINKL